MAGKMSNGGCRYKYGGTANKMRNLGGVKAPSYGSNSHVMAIAKKGDEGTVSDAGIEVGGLPAKGSLSRPGRKFGGRARHKAKRADDGNDDDSFAAGGRLTARGRDQIAQKNFALSGRRYPINDANHARNALARVSQFGSPEEKAKVRAAVHRKYPGIGKD